jgi:endonuclease/exonuclease/phosphatase family metal-dependent hydrolase
MRDHVTIKPDTTIYVTTKATVGYAQPDLSSPAKVNVAKGAKITGNGQAKTSKTFVRNTQGFWFLRQDLDVRKTSSKPKPKPVAKPIVGLRVGTLNMPDDTKVPALRGETTRAEAAAAQIEHAGLHIVLMQELVMNNGQGRPSSWAGKVLKALGSEWGVVVPRTVYNEDYIFYRKAVFNVDQLDDIIIRVAGVEGKHGTPAILTHEATGRELFVVCTHLVANNESGAGKQGSYLGPRVKELAGGRVTIVGGDMNTNGMLSGLDNAGLKNTRKAARKTDNSATYTNQSKSKPSTSVEDIIDQIWVSDGVSVVQHEVVSAVSGGRFVEPRISDHMLVWAELNIS